MGGTHRAPHLGAPHPAGMGVSFLPLRSRGVWGHKTPTDTPLSPTASGTSTGSEPLRPTPEGGSGGHTRRAHCTPPTPPQACPQPCRSSGAPGGLKAGVSEGGGLPRAVWGAAGVGALKPLHRVLGEGRGLYPPPPRESQAGCPVTQCLMPALGAPGVCATPRCPRKMPSASQIPLALELTCMQWARLGVGGGGWGVADGLEAHREPSVVTRAARASPAVPWCWGGCTSGTLLASCLGWERRI